MGQIVLILNDNLTLKISFHDKDLLCKHSSITGVSPFIVSIKL